MDPSVALSIVVLDPISTLSSITTFPVWGILINSPFSLGVKPNPSEPIIHPEWNVQSFPISDYE